MTTAKFTVAHFRSQWGPGDLILLLYILAFTRQLLWIVDNNLLAWLLAVALAATCWWFYVTTKPFRFEKPGREFWLVVALPLFFVYLLRLPFPDVSFDVLNYRLLHGSRSLEGALFRTGDFFPTPAPYNPAPDTVTALFRIALGYRLGTIVNLFVLVWTASVVKRFLDPLVKRVWLRAVAVLFIVLAEQLLFEINTYMVDLLALPLMLEATYLTLKAKEAEAEQRPRIFIHVALLLGISTALKLTNLVVIIPVMLLSSYEALVSSRRLKSRAMISTTALSLLAFVAPSIPFAVYLYRLTGNPFFPLGNKYFKSPFWETAGGWDGRWGPVGFWETVGWPVLSLLHPERHSELAVYSGRLAIGSIVAIIGLTLLWRHRQVRVLSAILIAGCSLWSAGGMGYSRYGLYLELIAGVVIIAVLATLFGTKQKTLSFKTVCAGLILVAFAVHEAMALRFLTTHEWSMRPTALSDWKAYAYEVRFILRDRSLMNFIRTDDRVKLSQVGSWVETGSKSTGIEVLLYPDVPIISVNHEQYFLTRQSKQLFANSIERLESSSMYSLCFPTDLSAAEDFLKRRGLTVSRATPLQVPFFSSRHLIGMMLLEIPRPEGAEARQALEAFWKEAPFADADYRANIKAISSIPAVMSPGEKATIRFVVRNLGSQTWPASGNQKGWYQVTLADRWLNGEGDKDINAVDARTSLPTDLQPGADIELALTVTAPNAPGVYQLEFDMVHEGLAWFRDKGAKTVRVKVSVQ